MIYLERIGSSPWGTFGALEIDEWQCCTLEPAWKGNARGESCIPAGHYGLQMRESPVVSRTTGGRFKAGWEVTGVPGRSFIMIHPGNWDRNSDGCLLVGKGFGVIADARRGNASFPGVTASQATFAALMERLAERELWDLAVIWQSTDWP